MLCKTLNGGQSSDINIATPTGQDGKSETVRLLVMVQLGVRVCECASVLTVGKVSVWEE